MIEIGASLLALLSLVAAVLLGSETLGRRAFAVVAVAAAAAVLTGALSALVPGDPLAAALGEDAPEAARAALAREMGLDDNGHGGPLQPLRAGGRVLTGLLSTSDPLRSLRTREPVLSLVAARLPWTLALAGAGVVVGALLGVLLGLLLGALSAPRGSSRVTSAVGGVVGSVGGSVVRSVVRVVVGVLVSGVVAGLSALPRFVLGPALVVGVALGTQLLPGGGVDDGWRSLVLPAATLALPFAGLVARHVRGAVVEALQSPFLRTARSKGASGVVVVVRHALPHAWLPVVHLTALQAGALVGGAVVVEKVFSWPGLGMLLQDSLKKADVPVVQGVVVVAAAGIAVSGLVADVIARVVDPRLRRRP